MKLPPCRIARPGPWRAIRRAFAPAWLACCIGAAAPLMAAPAGPAAPAASAPAADDARAYVQFVQDFTALCVQRNGVQIQVRNSHPQRTLRVWLDRIHMGVGTGDRSRSELKPGAEPEPLGCSRTHTGVQEWRIVRAQWVD